MTSQRLADAVLRVHRRSARATAAVVAVAALLVAGCHRAAPMDAGRAAPQSPKPAGSAAEPKIDAIVAQCTEDMVRQTCRIMGNAAGASVPDDTVIFVAGIGAIDAQVYNRLRADGEAMCETVRRSCRQAWDGPPCRTARALYGGA